MDLSNSPIIERGKTTIIIPVLNESGNVKELLDELNSLRSEKYFSKISEIIFVDDGSTDGTQEIIKQYSKQTSIIPSKILERTVKYGTVNAQLFGITNAKSEAVIVMDGDLQHPVKYIPLLIEKYLEGYDLVLASRYVKNGVAERTAIHGIVSRGANMLAKFILPWVAYIRDPISGYFIVNKRIINSNDNTKGFSKLALSILSTGKKISVTEIPFHFKERRRGESKVATGGTSYLLKYFMELLYYRRVYKLNRLKKVVSGPIPDFHTYK